MGMKNDYKEIPKLHGGPGGWKCSCCNPYATHPRNAKAKSHRLARRVTKQKVKQEIEKGE